MIFNRTFKDYKATCFCINLTQNKNPVVLVSSIIKRFDEITSWT